MQVPFADPLSGLELQGKALPLVGREVEMQTIRALLDTVVFDRPTGARALMVSGDVGIGKSRLLAEIYEEARGFRVLEGRTYAPGSIFPYFPFIEALRPVLRSATAGQLRAYVGLDDTAREPLPGDIGETISLAGSPLVTALAGLFPELPKRLHVTIEREALSPEQEKFRLFDAIATLLEGMAMEQPVLLGIDDLQWADSGSLELTMYLTVRLHTSSVALIGLTRPPGVPQDGIAFTASGNAAARALGDLMRHGLLLLLPLGPLGEDAAEEHLHALLPGTLPSNLVSSLLARAEGNPFFLEELVRMLSLDGQLVLHDDAWRATSVLRTALPESITLAIEQRLQGLSQGCRELLRVAALCGRTFLQPVLVRALGTSEEDVQSLIDEAGRSALIAKVSIPFTGRDQSMADDTSAEQEQSTLYGYMFCQGIVQEVLSAEVSPDQARLLHGAIGRALEAVYWMSAAPAQTSTMPGQAAPTRQALDATRLALRAQAGRAENGAVRAYPSGQADREEYAELAHHYALSDEKEAAVYWSLLAGEDAVRKQVHREAISHFRVVLKLLGQDEKDERKWSLSVLPTTLARLASLRQDERRAEIHLAIGESWFKLGELELALNEFLVGVRLMAPAGSSMLLAKANRLIADIYRMQGKYELALAHLQVARSTLDGLSAVEASSEGDLGATRVPGITEHLLLLQAQATLDILFNHAQEAERALWQSHQLATEIGDRGSQAFALHMISWIRGWGEHIYEAIRLQKQAHELFVAVGDPFRAALGDQGLGIIYQALGEMEQAHLHTLRGFERARRYGVRDILGWLHWNSGVMALAQGDWASSESHLQAALQEAEVNNNARLTPIVLQAQAELHFRRGNWQQADRLFQAAITASINTEWYPSTVALYGHFLAVTGRREAAWMQLERSAELPEFIGYSGHFYIPFLAEAYLHLGAYERAATYIERIRTLRGFMYYGTSVDRILGEVATVQGDWETAEQAFEHGLALCQRANNEPEVAAILYEQARAALIQSGERSGGHPDALQRISRLCERARALFLAYGMQRAADLVDTLQVGARQLEQHEVDNAIKKESITTPGATPTNEPDKPLRSSARREYVSHPGYQLELHLTNRELEVLRLVAEGYTDREMADILVISPRTVNRHLSNIFVKMDVPGRAAAVAFAIRQGLVG